jgi:hypothetical protein
MSKSPAKALVGNASTARAQITERIERLRPFGAQQAAKRA